MSEKSAISITRRRVSTRVRHLRESKHLSQEQLARKACLPLDYVVSIEQCRPVSLAYIPRLAEALGIGYRELWTPRGTTPNGNHNPVK